MKKKYCARNADNSPDCQASLTTEVETAAGVEEVHVNMETGEITYGPSCCDAACAASADSDAPGAKAGKGTGGLEKSAG